ncbi:TetR/AcrR family transcriptional regulator [Clostridium sp. CM028]|uniref:TetR/AcrR family transcriptional regulator n=1 Tax=unclassified Clostridium TaxID=2614128 RepID=UPI001C6EFCBF|nr:MULTISPECIES: TetR/AcrR family transcriptional regulator [unclassified Clostridium]MBW9144955.1 TetR/AcrR family transcriptional regulator [Clostridium sp. CM027]MBW9148626.1 TetR/AcrR family transcriptional regulator [Clostridium sp. CM028]UVE40093.1 TetR/AcrR family transcriptional regulator [Clostridium sp. CM027]WLC60782.1 TetR/AcrR family transcriptional regulator [Clostridium sp. CM028]
MYQIFYKLDEEKQNRIINAGTNIFSIKDYKHASTDDIAAEAKISKGSLFQYFKNKKSLFIFLYEYAMKNYEKKVYEKFNFDEKDYFKMLTQSLNFTMVLLEKYPYMYKFVIKASCEKMPEIADSMKEINDKIEEKMYKQMFEKIDLNKFKDGTDIEKLNKMIGWCSEGIWNEGVKNHSSMSEMYEQALDIYDFYKNAVYKEEYL